MDHFREEIIVRKRRGLFNLGLTLVTIGMAVALLMTVTYVARVQSTLMTSTFNLWDVIFILLYGAVTVGLFYVRVNMRVEYEYSFTNGELDVDKVVNNTKRKRLLSVNIRTIEMMAAVEHPSYAKYDGEKTLQRIYAVLNRYSQTYFMVFGSGDDRKMLLFEPSDEMVQLMRQYNAKAVIPAEQDQA